MTTPDRLPLTPRPPLPLGGRGGRGGRAGFTLIEVLTAITIAVLILGSITYIFAQASRTFAGAQARVQIYQQTRAVFDLLERDLEAARTIDLNGDGTRDRYFVGTATTLQFVSATGSAGAADRPAGVAYDGEIVEVLYHFDSTANKLYRAVRMAGTYKPTAAGWLAGLTPPIPASDAGPDTLLVEGVFPAKDPADSPSGTDQSVFQFSTDGTVFTSSHTANAVPAGNSTDQKPPLAVKVFARIVDDPARYKAWLDGGPPAVREDVARTVWVPAGR